MTSQIVTREPSVSQNKRTLAIVGPVSTASAHRRHTNSMKTTYLQHMSHREDLGLMHPPSSKLMTIALVLVATLTAQASHIVLEPGSTQEGWKVVSTSPYSLELLWNASTLEADTYVRDGITYAKLLMDQAGPPPVVGAPELPVIRSLIRVPKNGAATSMAVVTGETTISLGTHGIDRVSPRYAPVPKTRGSSPEDGWVLDEASYAKEAGSFGATSVIRLGCMRGVDLAVLELSPVSYDPLSGTLNLVENARVSIHFEHALEDPDTKLYTYPFTQHITATVLNAPDSRDAVGLPAGYLIVVDDGLYNAVRDLATWKARKGFHVTVTKTSDIPGGVTNSNIRQYVKTAYTTWDVPPVFLLLVGDTDTVPRWIGTGSQTPDTDLYYGCMDEGSEYMPDMYVGRLACRDAADVEHLGQQTIEYEQALWSQGTEWAGREYFISSDDWNFHGVTEGTHAYCMAKARSYGVTCDSLWGFYGTGTPIDEAVNSGRAMVTYSGHGIETMWQGPIFSKWNVSQLTNLDKYPVVLSFACLTGAYHSQDECLMERWIRVHDKGAIVSYGASKSSTWNRDDILQRRMWDVLFDDEFNWSGGFILEGKIRYAVWDPSPYYERGYFEMYNVFGDPSLLIYTLEPLSLSATFPSSISAGIPQVIDLTISREGQPCEGALVGLYKENEVQGAAYTDAGGQASIEVNAATAGSLDLTVTAYNSIAFSDVIQVEQGDIEPPTAPIWIDLDQSGLLTWGAAADNIGVTSYRVYRHTEAFFSLSETLIYGTTTDTNYDVSDSVGDTETHYYFLVTALDAAQNESASSATVGEHDYLLEQ